MPLGSWYNKWTILTNKFYNAHKYNIQTNVTRQVAAKQVHEAEGVPKPARLHKLTEIKFHPKMASIAMYYASSNCPVLHGIAEPYKALRASLVYMYVYCISVIDNYIRQHTHQD